MTIESVHEYQEREAEESRREERMEKQQRHGRVDFDEVTQAIRTGGLMGHQWILYDVSRKTPFDELSSATLEFLINRTNFEEPYLGLGFASEIEEAIKEAFRKKERCVVVDNTEEVN